MGVGCFCEVDEVFIVGRGNGNVVGDGVLFNEVNGVV